MNSIFLLLNVLLNYILMNFLILDSLIYNSFILSVMILNFRWVFKIYYGPLKPSKAPLIKHLNLLKSR